MAGATLVKKLMMKPGMTGFIMNAPAGYRETLGQLPESIKIGDRPEGTADWAQVFVKTKPEVRDNVPGVLKALKNDGILWLSYPKGTSKVPTELNRDILWGMMKEYGLEGVAMVSIDDTWSAMRFRPAEQVSRR